MDSHNQTLNPKDSNQQATKTVSSNNITPPTTTNPPPQQPPMKSPSPTQPQPKAPILPDSPWYQSDIPQLWQSEPHPLSPPHTTQHPATDTSKPPWDFIDLPSLPNHPTPELEACESLQSWGEENIMHPLPPFEIDVQEEAELMQLGRDMLREMAEYLPPPTDPEVVDILPSTAKRGDENVVKPLEGTGKEKREAVPRPTPKVDPRTYSAPQTHRAPRPRTIFPVPNLGDLHVGIGPVKVDDYRDYGSLDRMDEGDDERGKEPGVTLEELNAAGIEAGFPPLDL